MSACLEYVELIQGSSEWLAFRKNKITATDAAVIMGVSPWKTRIQLYHEKISEENNSFTNAAMQRGTDLEPIARELFSIQTGIDVTPAIVVKAWAMASLDGISACGRHIVEIKCPGSSTHAIALSGKVPAYYIPQLQHQMYVCDVEKIYYYSFDGTDGVLIEVARDDDFIKKMVIEESKFLECIFNRIAPEPIEGDYTERTEPLWLQCAIEYKEVVQQIKELERQEQELKKQLIFLSGESNSQGAGISLCQIQRKGNVDYSKIPQLKNIDLESFRKAPINSWRITCA